LEGGCGGAGDVAGEGAAEADFRGVEEDVAGKGAVGVDAVGSEEGFAEDAGGVDLNAVGDG